MEVENYHSDEDISSKEHTRLINAVSRLDKIQHIKKASRTEPALQVSEYHLSKAIAGPKGNIHLHSLVKSLNKKSTHTDFAKKLNKVRRKVKSLPKPLEKPQAQRIKRSVGFENLKKNLDKWEPLIHANEAAEQIKFPLTKNLNLGIETTKTLMSRFRVKSQLELEMEQAEPKLVKPMVTEEEFPLTMEEMLERRKESAKLRAQQSYQEAKARRQNKIKSKKYHRIQRREKIKQHLKEFEYLQKHDPEEALKKLEEIEKARVEERMSLRHRTTGKWAQSKQIRAKYDRDSRQVLAQQLAFSRDLTQKLQKPESSDESEGEENRTKPNSNDSSNPWINNTVKPASDVIDFVSGYRKFWNEKNKSEDLKTKFDEIMGDEEKDVSESENEENIEIFNSELSKNNKTEEVYVVDVSKKDAEKINKKSQEKIKKLQKGVVKKPKQYLKKKVVASTEGWEVEDVNSNKKLAELDLDNLFDNIEDSIQTKLKSKFEKFEKSVSSKTNKRKVKSIKEKYKPDLKMKSQKRLKPDIDEALNELTGREASEISKTDQVFEPTEVKTEDIDPTRFIEITPKHLKSAVPSVITHDEAIDDTTETQEAIIAEAFQDDDIVEEFRQDKKDEVDKSTPKDIDLSLPGWGSWGGNDIKKRSKKRFIVKMPEKIKRKDDNKGDLIIKENKDIKVRAHQVSEVPFPFNSVKDFEASIRAPIGNTFVPETAHRRLIKPSVVVKTGTIIEPMDENQLLLNKIKRLKKGKAK